MKAVDLNFARTPFRNNTPYYLGYGLGALLIVIFTAYNAWAYVNYSRSNLELETTYATNRAKLESLRREAIDLQSKIDKVDLGSLNGRAEFTNTLLERRRFSWTDLLNSLEEAQVYQVRLLSLLPRIQANGILIDARAVAHDLKSMWNFQQNLQIHPKFRRVYPGGWTKSTEEGEIVFNLAFNYFPQGAPEGAQGPTPQEAGLPGFVEAPGPGENDGGEDAGNEVDEAPPEVPAPQAKKAPVTATSRVPAGGVPTVDGGRIRAGTSPPPGARLSPDSRREDARAATTAPAAADPIERPGLPPATGTVAGSAAPSVPNGPSGATGATGNKPHRVGRGLPPGSRGVRPTPPPRPPNANTLPAQVPEGGEPEDDR